MALSIVLNSKTHRTSVCNSAESLIVHEAVADEFLPRVVAALQDAGVTIHGDKAFCATHERVVPANDDDWGTEYLSLDISAAVVDSLDAAVQHVRTYSSGHTEAIVTRSIESASRFSMQVDAAAGRVQASARFRAAAVV